MKRLTMLVSILAALAIHAALTPATLFSDHCVLQRDKKVPVWGKADPGATVTVEFAGQKKQAKADAEGRWRVDLDPLAVSCEPREMRIVAEGKTREEKVLKDVLVGVVWLCGGQSNMTFQMWPGPRIDKHAGREMNGYYDVMLTDAPLVRGVNMPQCWSTEEKDHATLKWFAFTPDNEKDGMAFSGAAWHFAIRLYQALKIPVGVIESAWGGSCIETWIPPDGYAASASFKEMATRPIRTEPTPAEIAQSKKTRRRPALHQQARACWNAMIYPLAPYGIEGAIWYQGCSNRGRWQQYYEMLTALRTGWSKRFEVADMPFFLCQITPYDYGCKKETDDSGEVQIREEMERFGYSNGNNVGCAILSDIGELDCIHPGDKRTVGTRLAALALNRIYGKKNLKCDAPVFEKAVLSADGKHVTLSFRHVEGWCMKGAYEPRFELAGEDGQYVAAHAVLKADVKTIDLEVPGDMKPTRVAYMRRSCVHGFLKNEAGLPLGPFRGLVTAVTACCTAPQACCFKDLPANADPALVSRRVSEQFLRTRPESYCPPGYQGNGYNNKGYGGGRHVQYSVVSIWVNALECARLRGDKAMEEKLIRLYDDFLPGGEKNKCCSRPYHVDDTIFGSIPYQIYLFNGDKRCLAEGNRYADTQWTPPSEGTLKERHAAPLEVQQGFWDKGYTPQTRLWIDDMYMIIAIQSQAYRATGDRKYIERTAKEMCLYLDELQLKDGPAKGLFYHAPDVKYVWGRGDGWMAGGMTLVLKYLPEDSEYRPRILAGYRMMMETLLKYQRADGKWSQLVDKPEDPRNWAESSCTAMFAYAFITGVKRGWLCPKKYGPAARKAWIALCDSLDEYANVPTTCCGTGKRDDLQYYFDRTRVHGDPHGQAPMLWCAGALLEK